MGTKNKAKKLKEESEVKKSAGMEKKEAKEHIGTLRKLQEKDPEFYEFLKEHDNELLEFDEEDLDDDVQTDVEEEEETDVDNVEHSDGEAEAEKEEEPPRNVITSAMVDSWCNEIRDGAKLGAVRSLLRAFRSACHYGDDGGDDPTAKFSTMSSSVFNKIMLFVLNEMDGILRGLLNLPPSGGKRRWRLKYSSVFLAAFPALLRKYIKVALHFWGTGSGALPVVSFLFLRDSCIRLGSDCLDDCIKGMYKAYVLNCQFVNSTKLQHLQFLSNCFTELLRVDIPSAYQHAFGYIRQLAMILKEALSCSTKKKKTKSKGKEEPSSSKKEKGKEAPSSSAKRRSWQAVNLFSILKVSKTTLKTRAFQEACVFSVVEELTEHLAQWSYSIAFMELSFIPSVRLRNFCKSTKVERFRREMRRLIRQIEANTDFINKKRTKISFLPNDPAAASFLEDEKKSGASPLSQYAVTLRQRAQERNDALMESSVLVGDHSSKFGNEITSDDEYDSSENEESDGRLIPGQDSKLTHQKDVKKKKKKNIEPPEETAFDQDIIEDFVLSSDEDDNPVSGTLEEEDSEPEAVTPAQRNKKRKQPMEMSKDKAKLRNSKPKKRKKKAQGKL
ncbi:Nucleolar complex protein 2 [Sesamum angolense]|uniref:Nucleolar complex protein 2 n=1 Tax=Sesamum angolense TaxID=2727404 RepID=A0AAE1X8T9_9LAMI|nr:Nucleolar complex protein 2 [Sesamum angolense]